MAEYRQVGGQLIPVPPLTNPCRPAGAEAPITTGPGADPVPVSTGLKDVLGAGVALGLVGTAVYFLTR